MKTLNALLFSLLFLSVSLSTYFPAYADESVTATISETWASGWVPPTTWKSVYDKPVIQSEINLELKTGLSWPQTVRLTSWIQNSLQGEGAFNPPAGEMDYALGLYGPAFWGANLSTEIRFIDLGNTKGASVGSFGDCDTLRFRLRVDRPFKFSEGVHTFTPSLTYFRLEPIMYRPKVEGNVLSTQLDYDWRPWPWFRTTVGGGYLHDYGVNGCIPADVTSYWISAGLKLYAKYPECWLNGGIRFYDTLDHPSNRPNRSFNVISINLSAKF
jgi:hypothetical protein